VGDCLHILSLFTIFVSLAVLVVKVFSDGELTSRSHSKVMYSKITQLVYIVHLDVIMESMY